MEMTITDNSVRVNKALMKEAMSQLQHIVVPAEQYIWHSFWVNNGMWRKQTIGGFVKN